MTFLEKLLLGLQTTLIGFVFVFVVLILLIGVVKLTKYFVENLDKIKAALGVINPFRYLKRWIKKSKKTTNVVTTEVAVNDCAITAAITAAITMMLTSENAIAAPMAAECAHNGVTFKVRSIKEIK